MKIDIITLFPEMCQTVMEESITGRAMKKGVLEVKCHQLRDYAFDKHSRVDDCPYGGGMGMLLLAEPIALCIEDIVKQREKKPHIVYMSPRGNVLTQQRIKQLGTMDNICILCGHYEGVDERVLEEFVDETISIGDYVLTGGEMPALILADAVSRMVPGVLSDNECFEEESHYNGLLEYPQYTRPAVWRDKEVPQVLLSGHHENIRQWRHKQALVTTQKVRPDMMEKRKLTDEEKALLQKKFE